MGGIQKERIFHRNNNISFHAISPSPTGLSDTGWDVAAVAVLMAIWWATETVPVAITALLPLALFPFWELQLLIMLFCLTPIKIYISF